MKNAVRLYIPAERIRANTQSILFSQKERHYLVSVMRIKEGEPFCVFDGKGNEYTAAFKKTLNKKEDDASAIILSHRFTPPDEKTRIALALCLLKGEKMDMVFQKATELGVSEIIPVVSERTIPRVRTAAWEQKKTRYAAIVKEASEQCGRATLPRIHDMTEIEAFAKTAAKYDLALFLNERERQQPLKEILHARLDVVSVIFLAGPEGGFTEGEEKTLMESGFVSVSLGENILRSETACLYGLSILSYELKG